MRRRIYDQNEFTKFMRKEYSGYLSRVERGDTNRPKTLKTKNSESPNHCEKDTWDQELTSDTTR
jgi:hypothetical protein